jgi:hypothetical protein
LIYCCSGLINSTALFEKCQDDSYQEESDTSKEEAVSSKEANFIDLSDTNEGILCTRHACSTSVCLEFFVEGKGQTDDASIY